MKYLLLLLIVACSKPSGCELTDWQSQDGALISTGCGNTLVYNRLSPSCHIEGRYETTDNGLIWYLDHTCASDSSMDAYCVLAGNEEYKNFSCIDLGINDTFYKVK